SSRKAAKCRNSDANPKDLGPCALERGSSPKKILPNVKPPRRGKPPDRSSPAASKCGRAASTGGRRGRRDADDADAVFDGESGTEWLREPLHLRENLLRHRRRRHHRNTDLREWPVALP